jgi:hypothetical protein
MNLIWKHECNEKAQKRNSVNASQATMEQPSRTIVHAKLEMTNPDSQEEVEADAAANDIVQGGKIARSILAGSSDGGMAVSSQMESRLNSMQGGGQIMPDGLRNMMERGFNRDFSQVRLHTDSEAASLSSSIHAKAFTHGNDVYFNQGQFSPNTSEGQRLMAHELTHVVQGGWKVGRDSIIEGNDKEDLGIALVFYGSPKGEGIRHSEKHGPNEYKYHALGDPRDKQNSPGAVYAIENHKSPKIHGEYFHLPETRKVKAYKTTNKETFFNCINEQQDNSISYMGIYSHGQSDQIILGGIVNGIDVDIHKDDLSNHKDILSSKFKENAIIDLWGCNLGTGENPIAQVLANVIGKNCTVYAFTSATHYIEKDKELQTGKNGSMVYNGVFLPEDGGERKAFKPN